MLYLNMSQEWRNHTCRFLKNYSICTEEVYVDYRMWPRTVFRDLNLMWVVTALMLMLILAGVIGNAAVCAVIVKHPTMRSNTNYYLFSLAISDLLLLLFGAPEDTWYYWHLYPYTFCRFYCKLRTFVCEMATYTSVLTVVVFSMERYLAICHPLSHMSVGSRRLIFTLGGAWVVGAMLAVPLTLDIDLRMLVKYPGNKTLAPHSLKCTSINSPNFHCLNWYLAIMSVVLFVIPMLVLLAVYVNIGIVIWKRSREPRQLDLRIRNNRNESRGTIKLLVAVVCSFFICWAPYHYQRIVYHKLDRQSGRVVHLVTGFFYYLSAAANPILYNIMSRKYRQAFKDLLYRKKKSPKEVANSAKMSISTSTTKPSMKTELVELNPAI